MDRRPEPTLQRHGPTARRAHLALAVAVAATIVTGLALGGLLPTGPVDALGGHDRMAAWHNWLGLGLVGCLLAAPVLAPAPLRRLAADMVFYRRGEARWWRPFVWFLLRPSRRPPAHHHGRFDPGQRLLFLLMWSSVAVLAVTGGALMLAPRSARSVFALALHIHIAAAWVVMATAFLHALTGSGLLRSHRGVARAMFGDGRVSVSLARQLWPEWTPEALAEQVEADAGPAAPEASPIRSAETLPPAVRSGSRRRGTTRAAAP